MKVMTFLEISRASVRRDCSEVTGLSPLSEGTLPGLPGSPPMAPGLRALLTFMNVLALPLGFPGSPTVGCFQPALVGTRGLEECCKLMFVFPPIYMLTSHLHCDGVRRWGLREVLKS